MVWYTGWSYSINLNTSDHSICTSSYHNKEIPLYIFNFFMFRQSDDVVFLGEEPRSPDNHLASDSDNISEQCTSYLPVSKDCHSSNDCGGSSISECDEDKLISRFSGQITPEQVICIFKLSGYNFDTSMECLLAGPTSESILKLTESLYEKFQSTKVHVDEDDAWCDLVSFYKGTTPNLRLCRVRICLTDQPPIDTGGIRRQLYTTVFQDFADNKHVNLFDGPPTLLRPRYSAQARSSGLFKILGTMVGHSLLQDGIGFPYLSPLCFWYIAAGEEEAMQHASLCDVGCDTVDFISKVIN